jgi:hypothetical protein
MDRWLRAQQTYRPLRVVIACALIVAGALVITRALAYGVALPTSVLLGSGLIGVGLVRLLGYLGR